MSSRVPIRSFVAGGLLACLAAPLAADNLGHRLGGDVFKPENTLHAYRQALEKLQDDGDFEYVELDVQETSDGAIAVFHDTTTIKRIVPKTPRSSNRARS